MRQREGQKRLAARQVLLVIRSTRQSLQVEACFRSERAIRVSRNEELQRFNGAALSRHLIFLFDRYFRITGDGGCIFWNDLLLFACGDGVGHGNPPFTKNMVRIEREHYRNQQRSRKRAREYSVFAAICVFHEINQLVISDTGDPGS